MFREVGKKVSLVTISYPSLRIVAPPPCLPLFIKDSLKDKRFLMEGFLMGILIGYCWLYVSSRAAFCTENFIYRL
jgi:hypothetical protein